VKKEKARNRFLVKQQDLHSKLEELRRDQELKVIPRKQYRFSPIRKEVLHSLNGQLYREKPSEEALLKAHD